MPSTDTIASTDLTTFSARTQIKSAEVNNNFGVFRGNYLPVSTTTSTAANLTYNLGAYDYSWLRIHGQEYTFNDLASAPSNPTAGFYKLYFKTDGNIYKLNSAGAEVQVDAAASSLTVVSTTGGFSIGTQDIVVLNPSGGALTCTLPSGATATKPVIIKNSNLNSSFNAITLDAPGAQTIDNTITTTLNTGGEILELAPDGANWVVVRRSIPSLLGAKTTTATWTTNVTTTGLYWRQGRHLIGDVLISISGAVTSGSLNISTPAGLNIDIANLIGQTNGSVMAGSCALLDSGSRNDGAFCFVNGTTSVFPIWNGVSNGFTATNPYTWASGDRINIKYSVPIEGWKDGV